MDSVHPLKAWIERHTTPAKFARAIEISDAYLSEILSFKKVPTLKLANRMSKATGGKVKLEAFVPAETAA